MKLLTFNGETPAEALKKAQDEFGEEALVVSTKEIRKKTLTQPALYEVVVAVEDGAQPATVKPAVPRTSAPPRQNQQPAGTPEFDPVSHPPAMSAHHSRPASAQAEQSGVTAGARNPYTRNMDAVALQLSDAVSQIRKIADVAEETLPSRRDERRRSVETTAGATPKAATAPAPVSSPSAGMASMPRASQKPQKSENIKELQLIKGEIDKLNDKIKLIQNMFWEEKGPRRDGLVIPHEFAEIYRIAKTSGMSRDHLDKIMQLTLEHMPPRMKENSVLVKRYFREVMRKMILARNEMVTSGQKKIIMLVGPTGVGKTTTLAKLAARYSFMLERRYKVGIITLDTYRIGAVEQLMTYAKKMKLSIDTVVDPPEFVSALNQLKNCDYILIDTVGSSQNDKPKIDALKSYLNTDLPAQVDVSLVISATTKYEDLLDIYRTFSILDIDTVIVTKLDETRGYGNIFSLMHETRKPLSYFSIGQEVPTDLMLASSDYLVDCLLDGFNKGSR